MENGNKIIKTGANKIHWAEFFFPRDIVPCTKSLDSLPENHQSFQSRLARMLFKRNTWKGSQKFKRRERKANAKQIYKFTCHLSWESFREDDQSWRRKRMTDRHTQVVLWACHSVQERAVVVRRLLLIRVPVSQILAGAKKLLQSGIRKFSCYWSEFQSC